MKNQRNTVNELTRVLSEEYMGFGSTPESAFESLVDDMINNRIDTGIFIGCKKSEIIMAFGNLFNEINIASANEAIDDDMDGMIFDGTPQRAEDGPGVISNQGKVGI